MAFDQSQRKRFLIKGVGRKEFKGNPMLEIPYGKPEADGSQEAFSFGLAKARAIVKYMAEIQKFVQDNERT